MAKRKKPAATKPGLVPYTPYAKEAALIVARGLREREQGNWKYKVVPVAGTDHYRVSGYDEKGRHQCDY